MRWLLRRGVPVSPGAVGHAAKSGRMEAVQFLREECGVEVQQEYVSVCAAASGSVPLATWLLHAGCPVGKDAYGNAAREGEGAVLVWLAREARCQWGQDTLREVMEGWCLRADGDSVEVMEERRFRSSETCVDVECASSLESVVWAMLEAGCPPGGGTNWEDSIGAAAKLRYLDLVRHLRDERGVVFAPRTLAEAARGGCVPLVEWLVGAGCRAGDGSSTDDPYVAAGVREDMAMLSCLRRLRVPWNEHVLRWAVQQGVSLRVLRWMVEKGAPWDDSTLRGAVVGHWSRGVHDGKDLAWFAERLGMCGPVAGGGAAGQ